MNTNKFYQFKPNEPVTVRFLGFPQTLPVRHYRIPREGQIFPTLERSPVEERFLINAYSEGRMRPVSVSADSKKRLTLVAYRPTADMALRANLRLIKAVERLLP